MINNEVFRDIDADLNHFEELYPCLNDSQIEQYYSSDRFNSVFSSGSMNDLSIIHLNIRSLGANGDILNAYLSLLKLNFDIVCLTETWVSDSEILDVFQNYNGFHSIRQNRRGGGSSIFVHKRFKCSLMSDLTVNFSFIESVFVKISKTGKNLIVGSCYRPPNTDFSLFQAFIDEKLTSIGSGSDIVACGDWNLDLFRMSEDRACASFYNGMSSLSLIPTISKPTRISGTSCSLIDNIFISELSNFTSGILTFDITDHFPIFLVYKDIFQNCRNIQEKVTFRILSEVSLGNFYDGLSRESFTEVINETSLDRAVKLFDDKILEIYNFYCPVRTKIVSPKDKEKPWVNSNLKFLIKQRERLFLIYKQNMVEESVYRNFRNSVNNKLKQSKKLYYQRAFHGVKSDVKKTWKILNRVLKPTNSRTKSEIKKIVVDNVTYTEPEEIANLFNDFFSTIGENLNNSMPQTNSSINDSTNNIPTQLNSFFFSPITSSNVHQIILSFKNKSSDISTYSIRTLKYISDIISPVLSLLINKSITDGYFPKSLKLARVIPLFKAGDIYDLNNFRGISILPIISKIFEKIVSSQVYHYFETNTLFTNSQFGFRKKLSTSDALLDTLQYVYDKLDKGETVVSFFLDFKKAFDCVNQKLLLDKMSAYGLRGVVRKWFESYLSDRQQYVSINGQCSVSRPVTCGVPQGSILRPLLFLIFINDFPSSSNFFKFNLFADDSTLSCSFKNVSSEFMHDVLSSELIPINNWLISNKIKLNADKTHFLAFSYRKNIQISPIPLGSNLINQASSTKFLGVHIDENLNFKIHIENICKKVSKTVGILHKVKYFLPTDVLKTIYNTLIYPYLNYGIETWYGAPQSVRAGVQILQKKAVRAVNNLPYNAHTSTYFKNGKILKLEDIYNLKVCAHVFNSIQCPDHFSSRLIIHSDIHNYNTRNSNQFIVPFFRRSSSQCSFIFKALTEYNSLPIGIKQAENTKQFKKQLVGHYYGRY